MLDHEAQIEAKLAEAGDGPKPLDVGCPHCGSAVGRSCTSSSGFAAATHLQRWRAVGIARPSADDRQRDYWDGEQRRLAAKIASLPSHSQVIGR